MYVHKYCTVFVSVHMYMLYIIQFHFFWHWTNLMLSYCSDDFLHFGEDVYVLTLFLFVQHLSFYSGPVWDFRAPVRLQVSIRSTSRSFYSDPAWKLIIDLHLGVYIRARAGSFYSGCISEFLFGHRLGVTIRAHLCISILAASVSFYSGTVLEFLFGHIWEFLFGPHP
jgi:hypothetical protein